jgi:cytochrome b subunit of formate dehydrogenase
MDTLARLFFWGYSLMLIVVGASGIFIARWELATVFSLDMASMNESVRATLLNQYRFLKAVELAFGIFCISYRRDIFVRLRDVRVFLAGVSAGVAARLGSWLVDGTPEPAFMAFMALELITGVLVWRSFQRGSAS